MDAELAEVLGNWAEAWRYPRLWVLLSRADGLDLSVVQKHLLEGLMLPSDIGDPWRELLEWGEFLAAERMLGCDDFLAESGRSQERLRDALEQVRTKRTEQLHEQSWIVQRRALAVGLKEVARSIEGVPLAGRDSVALALQNLRRAEDQVETAEAEAFRQAPFGPVPRPKSWPFTETPPRTILAWLRGEPGAPTDFKAWMPAEGDTGAGHLISALWWMLERKPIVDIETAERVARALVQFLGYDLLQVDLCEEAWCVRASLPALAPAWLPSFLWQSDDRLEIFIAHGAAASEPAADAAARGPSVLLDPFDAVERPPKGLIVLTLSLLFQLMREPAEARAAMLLGAMGRQIDVDNILPEDWIQSGSGPSPWPESGLAKRFLDRSDGALKPTMEECRRFLQRFFGYHGVRCEKAGDMDRIAFFAAAHPPLLLRFVRLLLARAATRGPSRPLLIGVDAIEELRASADWRRALVEVMLAPLEGDQFARIVLQHFLFELQFQGKMSSLESSIQISREEIVQYVEISVAAEQFNESVLQLSLSALERMGLIVSNRSSPEGFSMTIPVAAVLTSLMDDAD